MTGVVKRDESGSSSSPDTSEEVLTPGRRWEILVNIVKDTCREENIESVHWTNILEMESRMLAIDINSLPSLPILIRAMKAGSVEAGYCSTVSKWGVATIEAIERDLDILSSQYARRHGPAALLETSNFAVPGATFFTRLLPILWRDMVEEGAAAMR